jgi:hypothetical protein
MVLAHCSVMSETPRRRGLEFPWRDGGDRVCVSEIYRRAQKQPIVIAEDHFFNSTSRVISDRLTNSTEYFVDVVYLAANVVVQRYGAY